MFRAMPEQMSINYERLYIGCLKAGAEVVAAAQRLLSEVRGGG